MNTSTDAGQARALRLVFAGTPSPAVAALAALLKSRHEVVAVISKPDAAVGRGSRKKTLQPSPVKAFAEAHGIPVLTPDKVNTSEFLETLQQLQPDCCPIVAYGQLIGKQALAIPRLGWINVHYSLLPQWRGAAPVQHSILANDKETGVSIFHLEEGLDTGPVYAVDSRPINGKNTGEMLQELSEVGANLLIKVLDDLADGTAVASAQPLAGTLAPKLTSADARIEWTQSAELVDAHIRAFSPFPGAWSELKDQRIKIGSVKQLQNIESEIQVALPAIFDRGSQLSMQPGELCVVSDSLYVGTADRPILINEIQPAGKKMMSSAEWIKGAHLQPGDKLV